MIAIYCIIYTMTMYTYIYIYTMISICLHILYMYYAIELLFHRYLIAWGLTPAIILAVTKEFSTLFHKDLLPVHLFQSAKIRLPAVAQLISRYECQVIKWPANGFMYICLRIWLGLNPSWNTNLFHGQDNQPGLCKYEVGKPMKRSVASEGSNWSQLSRILTKVYQRAKVDSRKLGGSISG